MISTMNPIKEWRIKNKLTLDRAAELVGLQPMTLWRHENYKRSVSAEAAQKYQPVTGLPYDVLLSIRSERVEKAS